MQEITIPTPVFVYEKDGKIIAVSGDLHTLADHITKLSEGWTHKETIDPVLFIQDHYQKIEDAKAK